MTMTMTMTETLHTRTVYPYELDATSLISPEHSVRIAMAKIHKKRAVKTIFSAWHNLEEATRKLARIVTHDYPSDRDGSDILSSAILRAINAYEAASTDAIDESVLADAYMRALAEEASNLVCYEVHGIWETEKSERWEHLSFPLIDWVKKKGFERLVFSPRGVLGDEGEKKAAKLLVACQILTVRDTARLFQLTT